MRNELHITETDLSKIDEFQKQYEYEDTELSALNFKENNDVIEITKGEDKYDATESFYQSLCKLLQIPYPFSRKIPQDLFLTNVDRLKEEFNTRIKLIKREDVLVNVVNISKPDGKLLHFQDLNTSEILEYFNTDNFKMSKGYIGDNGSYYDFIHKDLSRFEIKKDDFIEVGYRIKNPFTFMDTKLTGSMYLNQLVCTNGMVAPKQFLNASINLNKVLGEREIYVEKFKNEIDRYIGKNYTIEKVSDLFLKLADTKIKYRWLKPIYSSIKSMDTDIHSDIFGISEGEQGNDDKKWFDLKFKENENEDYTMTYFDVIYALTDKVKKANPWLRINAENYTPRIIDTYNDQCLKIMSNKEIIDDFETQNN
jgi:hypothetical protein